MGRPQATSKDAISRTALEMFARDGYAATTIDDIAAAAGISRTTFFSYFSTKSELFWREYDRLYRRLIKQLTKMPRIETPFHQAAFAAVNSVVSEQFNRQQLCGRLTLVYSTPDLQLYSLEQHNRWIDAISKHLTDQHVDPTVAAAFAAALSASAERVCWDWSNDRGSGSLEDRLTPLAAALAEGFRRFV